MKLTIQSAADYVRTSRGPKMLLALIQRVRKIISFTEEHANRLPRAVRVTTAYKRGEPIDNIVAAFGCSRGTVLRYARMAGLPKRPKHFDAEIRKGVIAMYQQGKPIAEIEARLGVSQAYVSKTATEEGINRRKFRKSRAALTASEREAT